MWKMEKWKFEYMTVTVSRAKRPTASSRKQFIVLKKVFRSFFILSVFFFCWTAVAGCCVYVQCSVSTMNTPSFGIDDWTMGCRRAQLNAKFQMCWTLLYFFLFAVCNVLLSPFSVFLCVHSLHSFLPLCCRSCWYYSSSFLFFIFAQPTRRLLTNDFDVHYNELLPTLFCVVFGRL